MPAGTLAYLISAVLLTPRIGILGLALSTAASEVAVLVILVSALAIRNANFEWGYIATRLVKYGITAVVTVWLAVKLTNGALDQPLVGIGGLARRLGGVLRRGPATASGRRDEGAARKAAAVH